VRGISIHQRGIVNQVLPNHSHLIPDFIVLVNDESLGNNGTFVTSVVPDTNNLGTSLLEISKTLIKEGTLLLARGRIISAKEVNHGILSLQTPIRQGFCWERITNLCWGPGLGQAKHIT
jgi:hypothetical protein